MKREHELEWNANNWVTVIFMAAIGHAIMGAIMGALDFAPVQPKMGHPHPSQNFTPFYPPSSPPPSSAAAFVPAPPSSPRWTAADFSRIAASAERRRSTSKHHANPPRHDITIREAVLEAWRERHA